MQQKMHWEEMHFQTKTLFGGERQLLSQTPSYLVRKAARTTAIKLK